MKKDRKTLSFRGAGKTLSGSSYAAKIQQFFVFTILLKKKIKILQHCKALALPWGLVALVISFKQKKFSNYVIIYFLSIFAL